MADSVTFYSKLAAKIGLTTIAGSETTTKVLDTTSAAQTGVDVTQQTLTSTCAATTFHGTPVELDIGDVWKTYGHAIQLRNTSQSATNEPCICVAVKTGTTVASGAATLQQHGWYMVSGGTATYDAVDYAAGEVFQATATTSFSTSSGTPVGNLLVEVGRMYPGDPLGPIRRGAYTAAGIGAPYHWICNSTKDLTCPLEVCAAEADHPTA